MNIFVNRVTNSSLLPIFLFSCVHAALIDQKSALDLEILPRDGHSSLFATINQASTLHGSEFLKEVLSQPITCTKTLKERQEYIQWFITHPEQSQELRNSLFLLVPHEKALQLNALGNPLSDATLQGVYFSSPSLRKYNSSPYALDAGYAMHIAGLCLPLGEFLILHTSIGLLFNAEHDHSACGGHHPTPEAGLVKYYGAQAAILGCHIPSLYEMGATIKQRALITKSMQEKMIHVRKYLKHAQRIYTRLKQEKDLPEHFKPLQTLEAFFEPAAGCCRFQELLKLLESSTFSGEACLINHVGKVLAASMLYTETQQDFVKIGNALGEIDLYLSLAHTMEAQTETTPWCFVDYLDASAPSITTRNLRHLFLKHDTLRATDIDCSQTLHTLITGDNGSGKSTYINSLGHALILAHSVGIVPASTFEVTPLSHIRTYRFIEDNIFEGASRFYAECARIEDILQTIEHSIGFCCVLLDEPFTGTHATKGCNHLQNALTRLFSMRHVMSFTATHYHTLNNLVEGSMQTKSMRLG